MFEKTEQKVKGFVIALRILKSHLGSDDFVNVWITRSGCSCSEQYFYLEHCGIPHYYQSLSGANQLLWYYADLEKQRCYTDQQQLKSNFTSLSTNTSAYSNVTGTSTIVHDINHCLAWRRFAK